MGLSSGALGCMGIVGGVDLYEGGGTGGGGGTIVSGGAVGMVGAGGTGCF